MELGLQSNTLLSENKLLKNDSYYKASSKVIDIYKPGPNFMAIGYKTHILRFSLDTLEYNF